MPTMTITYHMCIVIEDELGPPGRLTGATFMVLRLLDAQGIYTFNPIIQGFVVTN